MTQAPADDSKSPTPPQAPDESVGSMEDLPLCLDQDDEILATWINEAERRADAYERGEMGAIDFDESIARARALITATERKTARRVAQLDAGEAETDPV